MKLGVDHLRVSRFVNNKNITPRISFVLNHDSQQCIIRLVPQQSRNSKLKKTEEKSNKSSRVLEFAWFMMRKWHIDNNSKKLLDINQSKQTSWMNNEVIMRILRKSCDYITSLRLGLVYDKNKIYPSLDASNFNNDNYPRLEKIYHLMIEKSFWGNNSAQNADLGEKTINGWVRNTINVFNLEILEFVHIDNENENLHKFFGMLNNVTQDEDKKLNLKILNISFSKRRKDIFSFSYRKVFTKKEIRIPLCNHLQFIRLSNIDANYTINLSNYANANLPAGVNNNSNNNNNNNNIIGLILNNVDMQKQLVATRFVVSETNNSNINSNINSSTKDNKMNSDKKDEVNTNDKSDGISDDDAFVQNNDPFGGVEVGDNNNDPFGGEEVGDDNKNDLFGEDLFGDDDFDRNDKQVECHVEIDCIIGNNVMFDDYHLKEERDLSENCNWRWTKVLTNARKHDKIKGKKKLIHANKEKILDVFDFEEFYAFDKNVVIRPKFCFIGDSGVFTDIEGNSRPNFGGLFSANEFYHEKDNDNIMDSDYTWMEVGGHDLLKGLLQYHFIWKHYVKDKNTESDAGDGARKRTNAKLYKRNTKKYQQWFESNIAVWLKSVANEEDNSLFS